MSDTERSNHHEKPSRGTGLEALARRYRLPLQRFFERRVRNHDDVPDLVQDVLMRLARLGDLSTIDQPEHYVFRTASSALRDKARRDTARHLLDHDEFNPEIHGGSDFSPERVYQGRLALTAVSAALRSLPEKTRDIFVLRVFEEQKTAQVAEALGLSTRSVELHYAKALAFLAAALRNHR